MPKTATKKNKTVNDEYTHRAVTDNKAGHDPVPMQKAWSDAYMTCETCGRQIIKKTS